MSRKRSGFAITSVRGGEAGGSGNAASASGSASPGSSRFRLVRLAAEPLRRGRWTCRDYYEREAAARGGGGRLPASLGSPPRFLQPQPPLPASASGFPPAPPQHQPRSLGAFAELVQALPPGHASLPRPARGLAGEESEEEEGGAGSGLSAIDNKIEQAMELVKGHLLLAVRFELSPAERCGQEAEEEEEEMEEGGGGTACPPPALATPTPHSSLGRALGGGLQEPFDAPRAAAALLGCSFAARCALGGAAAGAINVPPAQRLYRDLISLAVPPPPAPRRGALTPPVAPPKVPGPALEALGGRGAEGGPWLPPLGPSSPPRALPRPPGATFAMFRKLQQWGGG